MAAKAANRKDAYLGIVDHAALSFFIATMSAIMSAGARTSSQNHEPALPGAKFPATIICRTCPMAAPQNQHTSEITAATRNP